MARAGARAPLCGGLLVGGASRRMGTPKQLLEIGGRALGEIVATALAPHVETLCLLGDGEVPPELAGLPRLADLPGIGGPLAGMLAALRARPGDGWLVAACDQPGLTPEAVAWLVARRGEGELAVLPRRAPGRVEPFPGIDEAAAEPEL
ncbi:MAG TPA: molybdenum cofactor guanylyltransferase, partial [Thermoanaerobaculia bacterium]|nr:molybdenum cofactor guanylyltransferase [Thermoanaerobaculia bacterium]